MIYILFVVGILILLHNCAWISFERFFVGIFREFRSLFRSGPLDRGKINAILLIFMFIIIAFCFLVEPVQRLTELTHEVTARSEGGPASAYVFLAVLFMLGVFGLLSVLMSDRR